MLNKQTLLETFEYADGNLYWKHSKQGIRKDRLAGSSDQKGYVRIFIDKKPYLAHRIIFAMHHGYLPEFVDHIDGNPANNVIKNLRPATFSENLQNSKLRASNTSGYKGVCWDASINKWKVRVRCNKVRHTVGYFEDLELAGLVAQEAREKYHGQFARHL
jgi:hypothetical protein